MADGVSQHGDVCSDGVGNLRHRVNKRDFRGQKRVRRDFDELCCRIIHDQTGGVPVDNRAVDGIKNIDEVVFSRVDAIDQAVGGERVLDGEAFPQELRIPHQLRPGRLNHSAQALGGADRNRGFSDHDRISTEERKQGFDGLIDIRHIGSPGRRLRCSDREEVHSGVFEIRHLSRKAQAIGGFPQKLIETRFEKRGFTGV